MPNIFIPRAAGRVEGKRVGTIRLFKLPNPQHATWYWQERNNNITSGLHATAKLHKYVNNRVLPKFYSFNNCCTIELSLKNDSKIYIETASTCFGVTIRPSSGSALIFAF